MMNMGLDQHRQMHTNNSTYMPLYDQFAENVWVMPSTIPVDRQGHPENTVHKMGVQQQRPIHPGNAYLPPSEHVTDYMWTSLDHPNPVQTQDQPSHSQSNPVKSIPDACTPVKNVKMFTCEICSKQVTTKHSLEQHQYVHTGEKPYTCQICNRAFKDKSTLNRHYSVHSNAKPYVCDLCNKAFSRKNYLTQHKHMHAGTKPFLCEICKATFVSRSNLNIHLRVHRGEKPFVCKVCNRGFSRKCIMVIHMRVHTGEAPMVCNICEKRFKSDCGFRHHMKVHAGMYNITCKICKEVLENKHALKKHRKVCNYACDVCKKTFDEISALEKHKPIHSGPKKIKSTVKPIIISVLSLCKKKLKSAKGQNLESKAASSLSLNKAKKNLIKASKRQALNIKSRFICDICKKSFMSEKLCKIHMKSHSVPKSHICGICQRGFPDALILKNHLLTHNKQKLYLCNKCMRPFKDKALLVQHLKVHDASPADLYLCKMCNKAYDKYQYKHHKCEKGIVCQICKQRFQGQSSLDRHLRFHAIRKPYVCSVCHKAFINENLLKKHQCNVLSSETHTSESNVDNSSIL